ncbi:MAG: methylated-DNA--[protein]-cysteine S-methyltransferase [Acholeplasmatales bacterium]|nr:MAG: methylated-DNA--[protein]-cysteine S-methyltransferase [Acholeplasmatales bacterium]
MPNTTSAKTVFVNSHFGPMKATYVGDVLINLAFINTDDPVLFSRAASPLTQWLADYASQKPTLYNGAMKLEGTPFQQAVWAALSAIPYGQTCSYADIARAIKRPKAYRAVAQACKHNPIALIIPCHRVIAHDGQPGGYAGQSHHPLKVALLEHEQLRQ